MASQTEYRPIEDPQENEVPKSDKRAVPRWIGLATILVVLYLVFQGQIQEWFQEKYLERYLLSMYNNETKSCSFDDFQKGDCDMDVNSAVAHASTDPEMNTMNIALPDFTAEYWTLFVPKGLAPVYNVSFPTWSVYSALTAYDKSGVPVASLNSLEVGNKKGVISPKIGGNGEINLMKDEKIPRQDYVILYRVYRPLNLSISPEDSLPHAFFIPASDVDTYPNSDYNSKNAKWLPQASRADALQKGRDIGVNFNSVISSKLKVLDDDQYGTQLFYPTSISGLFVNANAIYITAFLPQDKNVMVIRNGQVPQQEVWRPFYGFMACDYTTTETVDSQIAEQLGGWGAEYTLFAARTEKDANDAGYNSGDASHKILLWGEETDQPMLVLRFIHFWEETTGLSKEERDAADEEREKIKEFDGKADTVQKIGLVGVSEMEYYPE